MKPQADKQIFSTNYQKVLKFLAAEPGREYMERDVREATGISKAGANNALRSLSADQLVEIEKKGRLSLYHVNPNNPLIRQIKVLINLSALDDLVAALKDLSDKIVLFGSGATGTDSEDSDIDLFVLTDIPDAVRKTVEKKSGKRQIHLVVRKPLDYVATKKKEKLFYDEVSRGIVLHERQQ